MGLGSAIVGGLIVVGVLSLTGNLEDGGTRVVTVPQALDATTPGSGERQGDPDIVAEKGSRSVQGIVKETSPAVVQVAVETDQSSQSGTGFVIDDQGIALTNEHVVEDAREVNVLFEDRSTSVAKVVGTDPDTDLAVLDIEDVPESTRPLILGQSRSLVVGDPVIAIGNPFGILQGTVTTGIVSALGRRIDSPNEVPISNAIQTDAAINKGNSGGPLLDGSGRVVGINSQIFSESGGSDGVGFAVPIDTVRPVARSILASGRAEHAWMGIEGRDLTPEIAEGLGIAGRRGVVVTGVESDGPSAKADLRPARNPDADVPQGGDIIVTMNGHPIGGMDDVSQEVASRPVGAKITVTLLRDGKERTVEMTLQDRPADLLTRP